MRRADLFERLDSLFDKLHGFTQLLFGDAQRRGEANDVLVGRFGQHAEVAHLQADIPSFLAVVHHRGAVARGHGTDKTRDRKSTRLNSSHL